MQYTKQEIEVELEHKRAIIRTLRHRKRPLEIQAAQKGIDTPPQILTEISSLNDQLRSQEDELARLESLAAEDKFSLFEAEYRIILAEAWDTPIGCPNVAGAARLELARLRMGLLPERAIELEHEVRLALAAEVFLKIDISPLLGTYRGMPENLIGQVSITINPTDEGQVSIERLEVHQNLTVSDPLESALRMIGKAIRLDSSTTLRLLCQSLPMGAVFDLAMFQRLLLTENRVWVHTNERAIFELFIDDLTSAIEVYTPPSPEKYSTEGTV